MTTAPHIARQPEPKVGQIWREVDPRFVRHIRVENVHPNGTSVYLRAVTHVTEDSFEYAPRSRVTRAAPERFSGKRGCYEYVRQLPVIPQSQEPK